MQPLIMLCKLALTIESVGEIIQMKAACVICTVITVLLE